MKSISCAVHGHTEWEACLVALIDTKEFQRLKNIRQLGAVWHVFPGATHTRFEHSLGVGHCAERFARSLLKRQPDLELDPFALKIAGLCHDLGHGPLSHAFDRALSLGDAERPCHEERSVAMLRALVAEHGIGIDAGTVDLACELIRPTRRNLPRYAYQIIANDLDAVDVDKFDYLCRDALYTGVGGAVDIERFFRYGKVVGGRLCYALEKMPHSINQLFMFRHQLHSRVYHHPAVRAFELMYLDLLTTLDPLVSKRAHELTDGMFSHDFLDLALLRGEISERAHERASSILTKINRREIYHCAFEFLANSSECAYSASDPALVVDCCVVGYSQNPLFNVLFYRKDGTTCHLPEQTSSLFARRHLDRLLRVYVQRAEENGSAIGSGAQ